jgi:outer membrane protein OmpA-like peptidoglycan-associated protein
MYSFRRTPILSALCLLAVLFNGTAAEAQRAGSGVGASYLQGKREADEILAGTAIDGVACAIGTYMDRQQERLIRIPRTGVERVGDDMLLIRFNSDVLFPDGSDTLDSTGLSTLEQVAAVINDYRKTAVVIQGPTESQARLVESFLRTRGVAAERMTALGSDRHRNRRVEVLLKAKSSPLRES